MVSGPSSAGNCMPDHHPQTLPEPDRLEAAADDLIRASGGDVRAALKAMILANEQLRAGISSGYARGALPRDRKDWYD